MAAQFIDFSGEISPQDLANRQQRLAEDFQSFDVWNDRYQYLIECSRYLPEIAPYLISDRNRVSTCSGNTYLAAERRGNTLLFSGASDSFVVAGMLGLISAIYSGASPRTILVNPPVLFDQIGLTQALSPHRRISLFAICKHLSGLAVDAANGHRLTSHCA
ncbi:SufE family protein [Martelella alba]|uniref:SufE family protein n=1 Tax=Martelella alba TaxID=2590451 RepID=A0A506U3N1_9HYPH|nr:SufE family protein [Martelella alba]TPW26497.1 SufE family protein [Martelella alba]